MAQISPSNAAYKLFIGQSKPSIKLLKYSHRRSLSTPHTLHHTHLTLPLPQDEAALLLCGLLLGFGLDAWVVVGRLKGGAGHTWVMTRGPLAMPCF